MTKNNLKQGCAYAKRMFDSVGLDFTAEMLEGEDGRASLILGDQAVIYNDHEAGEIKLNIFPVSISLTQIRAMFGVKGKDERDNKPPTPNLVPVDDVFDAVRRATRALVDLKINRISADLANEKDFQTDMDVVSHIPDKVVSLDAPPSKELALPGFDISRVSPSMRDFIGREDWAGAFHCYAVRSEIPVSVRNSHSHFMGDRAIRKEGCFTQDGQIAIPGYGDPRENYRLPRLGKCLAKKEGEDDYRVWVFDFREGLNSVATVGGMTEEQFNHYFTRQISNDTETDVSMRYVSSYGFKSKAKNSRVTMGSLAKLGEENFTDKIKLPSGFSAEYRKDKNGLLIEAPKTAFNQRSEIALLPLKDGSVMRIMLTDYLRSTKGQKVIPDIPVRIWDGKQKWKDGAIKVSVKRDEDPEGPYISCESSYPEINDRLSFMELNSALREFLPQRPKRLTRGEEAVPVALQAPTSIEEVRAHAAPPEVASIPGSTPLSPAQASLAKGDAQSHE